MKYIIHYNNSMEGGYKSSKTPIQINIKALFITGKEIDGEEVPTSSLDLVIPKPVSKVMISYLSNVNTWNENVFIMNYSVEKIIKLEFKITKKGIKLNVSFKSSTENSIDTSNEIEVITESIKNWAEQSIWQSQYPIPKGKHWTDNQKIRGFNIMDIRNIEVDVGSRKN